MKADFVIENISQLATTSGSAPRTRGGMSDLTVVSEATLASLDGRIVYAGSAAGALVDLVPGGQRYDAAGRAIVPGFVDSHTHLPFAGDRSGEFLMRLQGRTYQEIAAAGGGIVRTVEATRQASEEELYHLSHARLDRMLIHGTTTVEAKSGYGLDLENELKQLRVLRRLGREHTVSVVPTCMCAHDFPPAYRDRRDDYVRLCTEQILPEVRRQSLAEFFDVFVENGVFTRDQGERLCRRATELGFGVKIHADELTDTNGASLAAEVAAVSAEHLLYASEEGTRRMAEAGVVATLLPGVPWFLMMERHAPARAMIDAGVPVAIATDLNPGSSYTESMPMIMQLACFRMKLKIEEALTAATLNGAHGIRRAHEIGSLEPGKWLDAVVLDGRSFVDLIYHFGVNPVRSVIKRGRVVVDEGRLCV